MAQKIEIIVAKSTDPADVLDAAVDNIEAHPEMHEQSSWRTECGTGGCIAGWMVEAHPTVEWLPDRWSTLVHDGDGASEPVEVWAADLLGLNEGVSADPDTDDHSHDAYTLFSGALRREEVVKRAREFARLLRDGVDPHEAAERVHEQFPHELRSRML